MLGVFGVFEVFGLLGAVGAHGGDEQAAQLLRHHAGLVQDSVDAVGFSPAKAFCVLGGLGHVYLELLDPKYRHAAQPPKGNALTGAVALAQRKYATA